jgi:hypothetical protein
MNEIEQIRAQLITERGHAAAVSRACASIPGGVPVQEFRNACTDYLVRVLASFEERDQRLADLARGPLTGEEPARRALLAALGRPGTSREVLEKLAVACDANSTQSWQDFLQYFTQAWYARRAEIDALLAGNPRVADWRIVGGVDADSILEERARFARISEHLPAGLTLTADAVAP